MRSQAELAAIRATYAHKTSRENQGGPNFATTPNPAFFRDGKMNRDAHSDQITDTASASTPMFRTVRVEHVHYKSSDKDD